MDLENCTLDYFPGTNLKLYQHKAMFRMNQDTISLAKFMKIKSGERVLDIGTNNGALLLAASLAKPSYLCGIEIQAEACALARMNMEINGIEANIIHEDFLETKERGFHVVLCNPPYFVKESDQMENESIANAHFEHHLTLDALFSKVSKTIDTGHRFYMVHRPQRIAEIFACARQYRLEVKRLCFVYPSKDKPAKAVLIEAHKDGKPGCMVEMMILNEKE